MQKFKIENTPLPANWLEIFPWPWDFPGNSSDGQVDRRREVWHKNDGDRIENFRKVNIFLTFCYMFSQTADLNSELSRDFANCRFRKLQISQITDFANNRFRSADFVSFRFVNYSKPFYADI
jgi:hypothetical protein